MLCIAQNSPSVPLASLTYDPIMNFGRETIIAPSDIIMSPTQIHLGLLSLHKYPTIMQDNPNETLNVRLSAPICVLVMVNCRSMELGATNVIEVEMKFPIRVDVNANTTNHRGVLKY